MSRTDTLLSAIEQVHAAGLEEGRWPAALGALAEAVGVSAATLETYDLKGKRHSRWFGHGIDPRLRGEYLGLYDGRSSEDWSQPRFPSPRPKFPGGHVLDGAGQGREPFYTPYLGELDLTSFAAGVLGDERRQTVITVRQDERRGPLDDGSVRRFSALFGHVRQALQVGERLSATASQATGFITAIDLMRRAAGVIAVDGAILHANDALLRLAASGDGLGLSPDGLQIASPVGRRSFRRAMAAALSLAAGADRAAPAMVAAPRPSGSPPYLITLKPILKTERAWVGGEPAVLILVHDPLMDGGGSAGAAGLKTLFGLTDAEALLAQALTEGQSPSTWARRRAISINTAYTHLRRLKEKTGAGRLSDLISRLNRGEGG